MSRPSFAPHLRPLRHALPRQIVPWIAAGLLVLALPVTAAEVYQWKDAKGVTHYSDSPPPNQGDVKGRYIKDQTGTPGPTASAESTSTAAAAPAESGECANARKNLAQLERDTPVGFDTNNDGKADSTLNADQRAAQRNLAEASIRANCGTPQQ